MTGPRCAGAAAPAAMDYRAIEHGAGPIGFLDSRGRALEVDRTSLCDDARAVVAGLAHHGLRAGDRVLLVAGASPDYLTVLLGCLLAGVVPCTVAVPRSPLDVASDGVRRLHAAAAAVAPAAAIVLEERAAAALPERTRSLRAADLGGHGSVARGALPAPDPAAAHHIQLTSGSLGDPKAALLSHRSVAANIRALTLSTELRPGRDAIGIWLPVHHDMGLVQVLLALSGGIGLDLMAPMGFLRDPLSWLRHMAERRATLTGAPPSAYGTLAELARRRAVADLDLSHVRQMYVGAEHLPIAGLRAFRDAFAPSGLRDDVLVPCYGMAETVLASAVALDVRPAGAASFGRVRATDFDRAALLEHRRATPARAGRAAYTMVSCGTPVPGLAIRVQDERGAELADGRVGQLVVGGSSLMDGYLVDGRVAGRGRWHATGDLGVRHEGELYVVGRAAEMLRAGRRWIAPYEVEAVVEAHEEVGAGHAVVFGRAGAPGSEAAVAYVETRASASERAALRARIAEGVRERLGVALADVVCVRPGAIPRTTSGKRRRRAVADAYEREGGLASAAAS